MNHDYAPELRPCSSRSRDNNALLECRVCDDTYTVTGEKVPRLLLCGHTLCHGCLSKLYQPNLKAVVCPFDRQPTLTSDNGVWSLKKNFALVELLERLVVEKIDKQQQQQQQSSLSDDYVLDIDYEKQFGIACDENDAHTAVLFCIVCESHLCVDCSKETHGTRVLGRHQRIPLSKKPKQKPRCPVHAEHVAEFVCLEEGCPTSSSLMCLLCRDYGAHLKHHHALLDAEAERLRNSVQSTMDSLSCFRQQIAETLGHLALAAHRIGGSDQDGDIGSAETARQLVRKHFTELRNSLNAQETAALVVIDTHVCERLCALRQQEEDLATLLSQISSVCQQLERIMCQDDVKLLLARKDLESLVASVDKQQQQFADIPSQLNFETIIPVSFTKDNRVHIGPKIEMRVLLLGLDCAGKSTILLKLKQNEVVPSMATTIGFNVETLEYKNLRLTIWDVGGVPKLRPLWKHYYLNTRALIFVVDSAARHRLAEVQTELVKILAEKDLSDASLLILANKQDMQAALNSEELLDQLAISKLCCGRSWHLQPCDALSGCGLWDGVDWLARQLVSGSGQELEASDVERSRLSTSGDSPAVPDAAVVSNP